MSHQFELSDAVSLSDLRTFFLRTKASADQAIRLDCSSGVLRVTACTFQPFGLLDDADTVLAMRTFAERSMTNFSGVYAVSALLDRIARSRETHEPIPIPPMQEMATWVGVEPPQDGWSLATRLPLEPLREEARRRMQEVASALPASPGEALTRQVRTAVWSRPFAVVEHPSMGERMLGGEVLFTLETMGFFGDSSSPRQADVLLAERWLRVTTTYGHVLVFSRR